jgi:D-psicose/D-tagatose/L-ribulose 3-epimerase
MRIGASTFIWVSPFSTDALDLIDKVKAFGFDLIEICVEDPDTIDTALIGRALKRAQLGVTVCGAFGPNRDMSSEDPAIRDNAIGYTRRCVDIAAELGSEVLVGPMYAAVGNTRLLAPPARRQQWELAVNSVTKVADHAAERGIKLALEPLNRFETDLINTVDQALELVSDIGRDNVGFLLDTFHMNIEEKNIPDAIRRAGRHIFEFHACSNDRGTPGEDHLPWSEIVAALREVAYEGPVVIEAFTPQIVEIAKAVSLWRPLAPSQDALAQQGLRHLRQVFG